MDEVEYNVKRLDILTQIARVRDYYHQQSAQKCALLFRQLEKLETEQEKHDDVSSIDNGGAI